MNLNPLDLAVATFVLFISLISLKYGLIKNIAKTINLITSLILSNLVISNFAYQFIFLKQTNDFLFLSTFIVIFIFLIILLGFIFELLIQHLEFLKISKIIETSLSILLGLIKGFILIVFFMFVFETIPTLNDQSKKIIYNKFESNSFLFKTAKNLKNIIFYK